MTRLRALLDSPAAFWLLLSLPALPMLAALGGDDPRVLHHLTHPSGEWAARFLILALMMGPLVMLRPRWTALRWLIRRRRWVGVAAFGYAAAHLALYLADKGAAAFSAQELGKATILMGWAGFLIMAPLAATSWDGAVRRLGRVWKPMQRAAYAVAALVLLHWALSKHGLAPALVHFAPLAALTLWRLRRWALRAAAAKAAAGATVAAV
jgi:sulfoxide reductase heme-binding subunit YedZ